MADRFNNFTSWVGTQIVLAGDYVEQSRAIRCFIRIASECLRLYNFNTCMQIMSALNCASVQRLKRAWESLPSKTSNLFRELDAFLSPVDNHAKYREVLKHVVEQQYACIPYVGKFRTRTFVFSYEISLLTLLSML